MLRLARKFFRSGRKFIYVIRVDIPNPDCCIPKVIIRAFIPSEFGLDEYDSSIDEFLFEWWEGGPEGAQEITEEEFANSVPGGRELVEREQQRLLEVL